MWSWDQCGETAVVLLGFLTLAVSVGNLSTRGLQVRHTNMQYESGWGRCWVEPAACGRENLESKQEQLQRRTCPRETGQTKAAGPAAGSWFNAGFKADVRSEAASSAPT